MARRWILTYSVRVYGELNWKQFMPYLVNRCNSISQTKIPTVHIGLHYWNGLLPKDSVIWNGYILGSRELCDTSDVCIQSQRSQYPAVMVIRLFPVKPDINWTGFVHPQLGQQHFKQSFLNRKRLFFSCHELQTRELLLAGKNELRDRIKNW